jgi:hypothetical protein
LVHESGEKDQRVTFLIHKGPNRYKRKIKDQNVTKK